MDLKEALFEKAKEEYENYQCLKETGERDSVVQMQVQRALVLLDLIEENGLIEEYHLRKNRRLYATLNNRFWCI